MRGCVGQYPSVFGHLMDLLLALLRGQTCPVNIGLEAFKFLVPLGPVLSPFPLKERPQPLLRGESGPGMIFRQVISEHASEYSQQGVERPGVVHVRA